jgi:ERI1 exoribonuclease 2
MCLSKECARKKIRKDSYFQQWIDMRHVYRQFYRRRPNNFGEALTQVGIDFQGRQHSGIDDARNLASLVVKMLKDGVTLAITKDTNHLNKFNRPWR